MHLGSKQLRNRFEMRVTDDVHDILHRGIGPYALLHLHNRARRPVHVLWRQFEDVVCNDLLQNCAGVLPSDVIEANLAAKMRDLDALLVGIFITRAAISGVSGDDFDDFMDNHAEALCVGRVFGSKGGLN
ncbi:hypothetical protein DL239_19540 [Sedimentitalea sp. CY04]|uniref:Uncharacterized protein n=1 Tax=Parasedimentitalea denitrificans TaxID=2211118 RepID=A0ABX0WER1_9RHOB|nr:hypothetical protein [Sedimentitalea sp. CY04]NIZ63162.1 hypothetical protein [Sedimentitalea sp. CY04]